MKKNKVIDKKFIIMRKYFNELIIGKYDFYLDILVLQIY